MKRKLKGLIACVLIGTILTSGVVLAKQIRETAELDYNNIKISLNGQEIQPKDANGNYVEPFTINGTTYLPVRAVGEAIGKTVSWDGETQSVYLGTKPGDNQYLMEVCPPYDWEDYGYTKFTTENGKSFNMSGKKYTNGFMLSSYTNTYALCNLNSKYSEMTLSMGRVDGEWEGDNTVSFFVDGKLVKECDIEQTDLCKEVTIPLNYGLHLKIICNGSGATGFGNIVVK